MAKAVRLEEALENAVYVSDDISLRGAIQQGKLVVISTDYDLYARLIEKYPKEKVIKKMLSGGKFLASVGVIISIASGGLLIPIGAILTGAGIAVAGKVLDDYKDYSIKLDYDNRRVQFIKTKGNPRVII